MQRLHPVHVAEQWVINRSGWALLVLTEVFHKQRRVAWRAGEGGGNLSSMVKSQHCCSEIDVTLTLFSAVICLLGAYFDARGCGALKAFHRKRE